jgi:ATP-binding cassette subfamily C protein LapB
MQTAIAENWDVPSNAGAFDPLLASLLQLTRLLGRPWSAEAHSAGLPVPEDALTPELFVRAAARAGLTARPITRPLQDISSLVLPVVLLLEERQAWILLSRVDDVRVQVLLP